MSIKRGALIVLEGVDRSGKSTQCRKLVESLNAKNIKAQLMVFPDRSSPTGKLISEYLANSECKLHDKAIHLLFAANRWENEDKMMALLHSGITLIVDRYSYSGIAYSSSKSGIDIEWCKTQEIGLPKPDCVFMLTLSEQFMKLRPGYGNERYENDTFQKKVFKNFMQLKDGTWDILDASGSIENVHSVLLSKVLKVIEDARTKKLKKLNFGGSENNSNIVNISNL